MRDWRVRWILGVLGGVLIVAALVIRNDTGVATALIAGGCGLIVLAYTGGSLKRAKFAGVEFETREDDERAASVTVAQSDDVDPYVESIDSDDTSAPDPSEEDSSVIGGLNFVAGHIALNAIFAVAVDNDPLRGCELELYLFDEDDQVLAPVFAPVYEDPYAGVRWEAGHGATGEAYQTGEYVLATGAATHDGTHALSPEQQTQFADLAAVAAVPVRNAHGTIIAVLTASTADDANQLGGPNGESALVGVSLLTSRILIELLQWFDDDS